MRLIDADELENSLQDFKEWEDCDGTTGFDIYDRLNEHDKDYLMRIACVGLGVRKQGKQDTKQVNKKKKGGLF